MSNRKISGMNFRLAALACFFITYLPAQKNKNYSKEFLFITENDAYALKYNDSYYTNGFFFQLSKAKEKNNRKIINRYQLGQTMFTTRDRRQVWTGAEPLDRPYCGYLFAQFSKDICLNNSSIVTYKVEVGVTGDLSLARPLQEWYHKLIQLYFYPYWEQQIPNSIGINAGVKYATTINSNIANNSTLKIVPVTEANAGNFFINAKAGAYFCAGLFEPIANSALFNTRINKGESKVKRTRELFVYFYPQLIVQGYNATIQGNLFSKSLPANVFTSKPSTLQYQHSFGAVYAKNQWTYKIEAVYQTKDAQSQIQNHEYVGVHAAYRF